MKDFVYYSPMLLSKSEFSQGQGNGCYFGENASQLFIASLIKDTFERAIGPETKQIANATSSRRSITSGDMICHVHLNGPIA